MKFKKGKECSLAECVFPVHTREFRKYFLSDRVQEATGRSD